MRHFSSLAMAATAVLGLLRPLGCPAAVEIVRDGKPLGAIQYLEGEPAEVVEAAEEFAGYLKKLSGVDVPIRTLKGSQPRGKPAAETKVERYEK